MFRKLFGKVDGKTDKNDPEFEEKNRHMNLFLQAQELPVSMGKREPSFENKREKLKYVHFMAGAADQLSRTIKEEERAQAWWMTPSMLHASFQLGMDEAMDELTRYGRTDDAELKDAGKRGYFAMQTYMLSAVGKRSPDEFSKSCTELFAVVHREP